MAAAVATISLTDPRQVWYDGRMLRAIFNLSITAGPATYTTGGIACSLAHPLIKAQGAPIRVTFTSSNDMEYYFVPGTTIANGLLKIFTAIGTELGAGVAIPAANSGDTIQCEGKWLYGVS